MPENATQLEIIRNTAAAAFAGMLHSVFLAEHLILYLS